MQYFFPETKHVLSLPCLDHSLLSSTICKGLDKLLLGKVADARGKVNGACDAVCSLSRKPEGQGFKQLK